VSVVGDALRLRPLGPGDEDEARRAHAELAAEGVTFLFRAEPGGPDEPWAAYLERVEDLRTGRCVPAGWVPTTFLVGEAGGRLVGRLSVRHELTEWMAAVAGHIGYAVRPGFRRRGYATAMLRQGLGVAAGLGLARVLLTCDVDNAASAAVIERCGGAFAGVVTDRASGAVKRHYWLDTSPPPG